VKRWVPLIGRGGTAFIAVGLALLLVSFIPVAQTGAFSGTTTAFPQRFEILSMPRVLTPQQGLRFIVQANGTLNIYLLEVDAWQTVVEWINTNRPQQNGYLFNITNLEAFLEANPDSIGWQTNILDGTVEYEYIPTKITNASLVISNPSSESVAVTYDGSITGVVAPVSKVRTLALWTIPTGFVLALPWLTDLLRTKTKLRK